MSGPTTAVTRNSTWWPAARRRSARGGVGLLWVLGAVLSYSALRELALMLGIRDPLAYAFPLVIDVAVWVGSMNALEARDQGREGVEKYAWFLVTLYAAATIVGNVVVGATEALDPRLVNALGGTGARWAAEIAGSAPAVTMILFSHLAGLLMEGKPAGGTVEDDDQVADDIEDVEPVGAPEPEPFAGDEFGLDQDHEDAALLARRRARQAALNARSTANGASRHTEPTDTLPPPSLDVSADTRGGAEHSTETPRPERPRADRRPASSRARKSARGRARELAPRLSGEAVKAMVAAAREHVLADPERDPAQALDESIVEHLAGAGCPACGTHSLSRSRARTYLAELRRDEAAAPGPDSARWPRAVHLEAVPAAATASAQEA